MAVSFYDGTSDFYLNNSEFNGPRDKGKLEPVYTKLYELVKNAKPNNIVELGVGSGACTVAMARGLEEVNADGRMIGFDTFDAWGGIRTVYKKLKSRNLHNFIHNMKEGNVFDLWVNNPTDFDFLWIDIDNTWRSTYDVVFGNEKILNQITYSPFIYITQITLHVLTQHLQNNLFTRTRTLAPLRIAVVAFCIPLCGCRG